jgi:hypothetical protein
MREERRNIRRRAALVRRVIDGIVRTQTVTLTVDTLREWLDVPREAAQRILRTLASSGLVQQVDQGVWARAAWPERRRECP